MERIKLNKDVELSRIIQGMWRQNEWGYDSKELLDFIKKVHEEGITTFDHADIYGNYLVEEKFGEALKLDPSFRERIELISKVGIKLVSENRPENRAHAYDNSFEHIVTSAERSLKNLNTDHLDLLLIHRPSMFMDPEEVAKAFDKLKKEGKVKSFGVSNFKPSQFSLLSSCYPELVTNQIELSPIATEHFFDGTTDLMIEKKVPMMIWSPLAGGKIFTEERYGGLREILNAVASTHGVSAETILYAWLLAHPGKMIPICGSGKLERVKSAVRAKDIKLSTDEWFMILQGGMGRDID